MKKIVYLTNVSSPYRVEYFNLLGQKYDLTVFYEYEKEPKEKRNISWEKEDARHYKSVKKYQYSDFKKFDIIVICGISTPKEIGAILYLKRNRIPYILEADGGIVKNDNKAKYWIKRFLISGAKEYFSTGKMCDKYFEAYGASGRINRYAFTSLHDKDILREPIDIKKKMIMRKQLNLQEEKIVITVGRFSYDNGYGKGFDTIFHIAENENRNIGFYIIGDKPTEEFVRWKKEKKLDNIHFVDFMEKKELFRYYQAADVNMILTRGDVWGLVVNEALANGCPVISSDACVAGLELIKDGFNGAIVPVNNPNKTKQVLHRLVDDEDNLSKMRNNCIKSIKDYTFETMVRDHEVVFSRYWNRVNDY